METISEISENFTRAKQFIIYANFLNLVLERYWKSMENVF